jgi:hypothetical protein
MDGILSSSPGGNMVLFWQCCSAGSFVGFRPAIPEPHRKERKITAPSLKAAQILIPARAAGRLRSTRLIWRIQFRPKIP